MGASRDFEFKSKCLYIAGPVAYVQLHCTFFHFLKPAIVMEINYHGHIEEIFRIWQDLLIDWLE